VRSYLKNKAERAGDMVQAVKCLPSKYKALSSNSRTNKRKNAEVFSLSFFFYFLATLEFEFRVSPLLGRLLLPHEPHHQPFFILVFFVCFVFVFGIWSYELFGTGFELQSS
jgi:hypothetical protein